MNRPLTYLIGPETAMALLTALVFLFCRRHASYSSRDLDILNNVLWLLPVVAVPLAFATLFVPGAKSWWWPGRATVAVLVALLVGANRVVDGFKAPDSGPSVGVYGIFAIVSIGLIFVALANAVAGAVILAEQKPAFAEWFRARKFVGCLLTAVAAIPIGAAMAAGAGLILGVYMFFITLFKR